jgi:hypothetical protein
VELPYKHPLQIQKDPDGYALARSLLLSLLVIGMEQKYSEGRANLFVVSNDVERIRSTDKAPESILSIIDPQNEQVKLRLENFMKDRIAFSRQFLVKIVSSESFVREPDLMISGFLSQITARTNLEKKISPLSSPAVSMKNEASAKVVFVLDSEKCWIDGEITETPADMTDLKKNVIHVIGAVHTKNLKEVTNRIRTLVTGGAGEQKFPAAEELVITMGSRCTIDATAAMGFAQLLVSELSKYKKKKVIVSRINDGVLRKSQGFMMIREYVRVDAY